MLVVRGSRVILSDGEHPASIHIEDGVIAHIAGADEFPRGAELFDAGERIVAPGIVDTHVHVNEPGRTEWEGFDTATRAAASGGVTTIVDMGSNVGKDKELVSIVTKVVKEVARVPVWAKLTPSTTDIVVEARGAFLGGADAISSSNTFTSLPLVDPETLEFEVNVDGLVSTGGLGGPAILPLSLAKMSQLTQAFPDRSFSGIGGVSTFEHALNYFLLGCGTVQVCTAAMLDHAVGPNVIRQLNEGLGQFLDRHANRGWRSVADFVGLHRDRVVAQSRIRRPDTKDYRGGYDAEGYAESVTT